jgi:uncharacterized protein (TIGR00159 family)
MFYENIINAFAYLRLQDFVDIAIVSVLITIVLVWFRNRASRFVLVGLGLIGTVYALALFFQLYLTSALLQGFFAVFIFVLVVIFQEDIRRFFERLALWGFFRRSLSRQEVPSHQITDILVQTVDKLIRKRVGALIVIAGDDVLERHLSGGVHLDGHLSQALLESIFDVHSPGHDGAVIIKGNLVNRFGCRLPLSTHAEEYEHLGLRHNAALGLSERTDALGIVVSEERGSISIARGEKLQELPSLAALGTYLDSFLKSRHPAEKRNTFFQWIRENQREKIIAVSLACLLWFFFGYQRESLQRDYVAPIDYRNTPRDWVLEEPRMATAQVTLVGPPQAFRLFDPEQLRISLDLSRVRRGTNEITFTADMVNAPSAMTVVRIKPEKVRLAAQPLAQKQARVELVTQGKLPATLRLDLIRVDPSQVRILVHPSLRDHQFVLPTEPLNLDNISGNVRLSRKLVPPAGVTFPEGKVPTVNVTIRVRRR